jgi:hypothetical protein
VPQANRVTQLPPKAAAPIDDPALPGLFSSDRFDAYLAATGLNQGRAARLYGWNVAVSSALWGDFAILEVCLRNAIHACLSAHAGRDDWWNAIRLHPLEVAKINEATRAARAKPGHGRPIAGDVVAELTLGFWTGLLVNKYHQRLWVPALSAAFPHLTTTRREFHRTLERLRKLRNRLAHHEKVFNRNIADDHQKALEVLAAIDPAPELLVRTASRVPAVLAARADTVNGTLGVLF